MCAAFCPNSLKFLRTAATFICKDNFFVLLSNEDSHISTVEIYRYINEAIVMRDTMEARSTICLFVYLLIGWVVWIIVNLQKLQANYHHILPSILPQMLFFDLRRDQSFFKKFDQSQPCRLLHFYRKFQAVVDSTS